MYEDHSGEPWAGACAYGTCRGAEFAHEAGCPRRVDYSDPWAHRLIEAAGVVVMLAGAVAVLWVVYTVLEGLGLGCIGACAVRP